MSWRPLSLLFVCLGLAASACGETDRTLKVTGLEPERGDVNGDTHVIIKGNRFVADGPRKADVYFGTQQTGFYLQLELNGLASVGNADAFLEHAIRGYSPETSAR